MKVAFEKAIGNKFNIRSLLPEKERKYHINEWGFKDDCLIIYYEIGDGSLFFFKTSIYHLIYGTNLIKCLVGEPKKCCGECLQNGGERQRKYKWVFCSLGFFGKEVRYKEECNSFQVADSDKYSASYHLREMSTIRDIELLKEYVRGLV